MLMLAVLGWAIVILLVWSRHYWRQEAATKHLQVLVATDNLKSIATELHRLKTASKPPARRSHGTPA